MTEPVREDADKCEKLARMARQIADFFAAYPDEQAAAAVADHINQFWSRRMRADFLAAFAADQDALHPLVQNALPQIKPVADSPSAS